MNRINGSHDFIDSCVNLCQLEEEKICLRESWITEMLFQNNELPSFYGINTFMSVTCSVSPVFTGSAKTWFSINEGVFFSVNRCKAAIIQECYNKAHHPLSQSLLHFNISKKPCKVTQHRALNVSERPLCFSKYQQNAFVLLCVNERCVRVWVCPWRRSLTGQRACQNLWCSELDSCGLLIRSVWTQNSYPLSCAARSFWQRLFLKMNRACCNEERPLSSK